MVGMAPLIEGKVLEKNESAFVLKHILAWNFHPLATESDRITKDEGIHT